MLNVGRPMAFPRRSAVLELLSRNSRPTPMSELAAQLDIPSRHVVALERVLDDLIFDGSVIAMAGNSFRAARTTAPSASAEGAPPVARSGSTGGPQAFPKNSAKAPAISGRIAPKGALVGTLTVNPRGFGFVRVKGMTEDFFIAPDSLVGALHGDTVKVREVSRGPKGPEGVIEEIVTRASRRAAGLLQVKGHSAWLDPDDTRMRGPIVLEYSAELKGKHGFAAVCEITRFPETSNENPEGRILKILGPPGDPNVEVAKILIAEEVDEPQPDDAVTEAKAFGKEVAPEALVGREDLTGIGLVTIDPEDARDHDDAIWVETLKDGGFHAWIAIADVSHYVTPKSSLDASAFERATSVYLPDRAIPMLPAALSSNLCSLLPGVIRLCLAVEVVADPSGTIISSRIVEGFMKSRGKVTYPGAARALGYTTEPERQPAADERLADLKALEAFSGVLRATRMRRGALDFDLPEAKVVLNQETRAPISIEQRAHDPGIKKAYRLVEEMMLLANEIVARYLIQHELPGIFRNHLPPDEKKLITLGTMCERLGVAFDAEEALDPQKLSAFIKRVGAHPQKSLLHSLLLRSMKQAVYEAENHGHFGLASEAYLHFTSPIRRYPDIVVHRSVRAHLRKGRVERSDGAMETLSQAATVSSERERRAMEVEREVVDLYRALYMRQHLGERFTGTVSAIVGSGLYVALATPFVDVLVRFESLGPNNYRTSDDGLEVTADGGECIRLGDTISVLIEDVSIERRAVFARREFVGKAFAGRPNDQQTRRERRGPNQGPNRGEPRTDRRGGAGGRGGRRDESNQERQAKGASAERPGDRSKPSKGKRSKKAKKADRKSTRLQSTSGASAAGRRKSQKSSTGAHKSAPKGKRR